MTDIPDVNNVSVPRVEGSPDAGSPPSDPKGSDKGNKDKDDKGNKDKDNKGKEDKGLLSDKDSDSSDKGDKDSESGQDELGLNDSATDEEAKDEEAKDDKKSSPKEQVQKASMIANAASAIQSVLHTLKLLMWLKMMLSKLMSLVQSLISAVLSVIANIGAAIASFATAVASFIGTTVTTVAVGIATAVVGVIATVAVVVVGTDVASEAGRYDVSEVYDCEAKLSEAVAGYTSSDTSAVTTENAKLVYSVFSEAGLADYNIAGILGNWSVESGIDPTSIEGIDGERHSILGTSKSQAIADLDEYTRHTLFPKYAGKVSIDVNAYRGGDGLSYCGIGLGQWTGPRAKKLFDVAASLDMNWYNLESQLVYTLGEDSRSTFFENWSPEASAEEAAYTFADEWEGNTTLKMPERKAASAEWAVTLLAWDANTEYASSILNSVGNVTLGASNSALINAASGCDEGEYIYADNSSLAHAAVSYAYPTRAEGEGNNGTALYQALHDEIFPGDEHYMSCDRSVAVAVRWSGTDDDFPKGDVLAQLGHLTTSDKWTEITDWGQNPDNLSPGDLLIRKDNEEEVEDGVKPVSHIVMYVGAGAIMAQHPEAAPNSVIVSGSFTKRSPGVGTWNSDLITYRVFRNIKKEEDPQYTNAAASFFVE